MTFFTNAPEFARYASIDSEVARLTNQLIVRLVKEDSEAADALFKSIMEACNLPELQRGGVFSTYESWKDYSIKVNMESPLLELPEFAEIKDLIIESINDDAWMRHLYAQIDQSMIEEAMVQLGQTA